MGIKEFLEENKEMVDKKIEEFIPREFNEENVKELIGKTKYGFSIKALNESISKPFWDMLDRGGKRWRPALMLLIHEALGGKRKDIIDFVVIPEVIHNGTLIIDDVEDSGETRRGRPCIHKKFGIDVAINVGNTMYYIPLTVIGKNKDRFPENVMLRLYETINEEMLKLSFGQGTDIIWHKGMGGADNVSEKEYLQMCAFKTGTLARLAAKMGALLAGADDEKVRIIGEYAETIGVGFQIQDDILDIIAKDREKFGKVYGNDIKEGKRTLMVIHSLQNASEEDRVRLLEILGMHTDEKEIVDEAISIMEKYGSVPYAKEYAEDMVRSAWEKIEKILPPTEAKEMLKEFTALLVKRDF